MNNLNKWLCAGLSAMTLSCGGKDPKLVEKRELQKVEIARLEGELALLKQQDKERPEDASSEISRVKVQVEELEISKGKLANDLDRAQKNRAEVQSEFESFKNKYPIK